MFNTIEAHSYTLWIEEASHPKFIRPARLDPRFQLLISLDQLCEPKAKGRRFPRLCLPNTRNPCIIDIVQSIFQLLETKSHALRIRRN